MGSLKKPGGCSHCPHTSGDFIDGSSIMQALVAVKSFGFNGDEYQDCRWQYLGMLDWILTIA